MVFSLLCLLLFLLKCAAITERSSFIDDDIVPVDPILDTLRKNQSNTLEIERTIIANNQEDGRFIKLNFLDLVESRKRIATKNPCYPHSSDEVKSKTSVFCMPYFYILGPQKVGTTDTFERIMRHPDVVRLDPIKGEMLEPHLWTNRLQDDLKRFHQVPIVNGVSPLFRYSSKQYHRHLAEILQKSMIVGDASSSLMYRVATPAIPTPLLLHAIQPDAKLIAVLRDPVERTYSDFRFFFHCGLVNEFQGCPIWWPPPRLSDIVDDPASRFHKVVLIEIEEFKNCLNYDSLNIKNSSMELLTNNVASLNQCKRRPDLNRDPYLNKCYSGRAVLSLLCSLSC